MFKFYLVAIIAVVFTAISQLLLKFGALHGKKINSFVRSYINAKTITGYFLLFVATLLNLYAFKYIELKKVVILLPATFLLVALLSCWLLKERFSKNQSIGSMVILAGIVVFHL